MTRERKPFISMTAKMTPRHRELIKMFDGLLYSGDRTKKALIKFNGEHAQAEYQLTVDDANDLRKLVEAECALEVLKAQNKIDASFVQQILNSIAQSRDYLEQGQVLKADRHLAALSRLIYETDIKGFKK